jgi:estrogen-related receptor beta like 1
MADATADVPKREARKRRQVKNTGPSPGILMEQILEKLKHLNYVDELCRKKAFRPFARTLFATKGENQSTQFACFLKVVVWLMSKSGRSFEIDKFDDPNTSVVKVMLELKDMGFESDVAANKLKQPYGMAVCTVLTFLTDKALEHNNFSWDQNYKPDYPDEDFAEEAEVNDEMDIGEEDDSIEEDLPSLDDDDDESVLDEEETGANGPLKIIEADVDAVEWKKELERVAPRLKFKILAAGKEWKTHLLEAKHHEKKIGNILPNAQAQLHSIEGSIKDSLERIQQKEGYMNQQFDNLSREYREMQEKFNEINERYNRSNDNVQELTNSLSIINDQLEEAKARQDETGSNMTDTKPLVRMKDALKKLQEEMKEMELKIGVVGYTLLNHKMRRKIKLGDDDSTTDTDSQTDSDAEFKSDGD